MSQACPRLPHFSASPLMHGAGFLMAIMLVAQGVAVATLGGERFDPALTVDAIAQQGIGSLVLVGDAFAVPLLEELDRRDEPR